MEPVRKKTLDKLKSNSKKTYLTYMSDFGKDSLSAYYDKARSAKTDYMLSDADYGVTASKLLSSGLTDSGYSDYLESVGDKSYAARIAQAEGARMADEYKNRSGYEKYLSDYDAMQSKIAQSLLKSIGDGNDFDYGRAFEKAVSAGLSETLAAATASKAILLAKKNTYLNALAFAKANNLSAKKAKEYAKFLGLSEIYAERIYREIAEFDKEEKQFYSSMSADDYYNYILSQSRK